MDFRPNMVSGVTMTPDTSQAVNVLANSGAQQRQVDQMRLAEVGRNKAYLQDMISKSFANISAPYREEYVKRQNQFIDEAAKVWRGSDGYLSMEDNLKLESLRKPLDQYVATYKDVEQGQVDAVQKINELEMRGLVDGNASRQALKKIIDPSNDLETTHKMLNDPNNYLVKTYQPINYEPLIKNWSKMSRVIAPGAKPTENVDMDGNLVYDNYTLNKDNYRRLAENYFELNKENIKREPGFRNKRQWVEDKLQVAVSQNRPDRSPSGDNDANTNDFAYDPNRKEYVMSGDLMTNYPISKDEKLIDEDGGKIDKSLMENSKGTVIGLKDIDGEFHVILDVPFNQSKLNEVSKKFISRIDDNGNIRVYKKLNKNTDKNVFENNKVNFLGFDWETGKVKSATPVSDGDDDFDKFLESIGGEPAPE